MDNTISKSNDLMFNGTLNGDIAAAGEITLGPSADIHGEVRAPRKNVRPGRFITWPSHSTQEAPYYDPPSSAPSLHNLDKRLDTPASPFGSRLLPACKTDNGSVSESLASSCTHGTRTRSA
jgi:hypothetical protein